MTRTTFVRLRFALLFAATGALLLTGCSDSVTMPEEQRISEPASTGRGEVENPFRIKDPDVPVGIAGGAGAQHVRITDPNITIGVR
ncbi:MAG TPA: hypothetical protein VFP10_13485 [Candidatus Eisenbacteria bacterium]|nr:hypothetical protein [Candidatus Eisenbacteria bacterium]